jgi:YebC/PmpR family DNA-binding regulatory protein
MAIEKARAANMPMANIERAIQRATDKNAVTLQEVMYEGYGPGGVGILVECATDNINRTHPEVRSVFVKKGGNLAESGAVAFLFKRKGEIRVKASGDESILSVLDAGAEDAYEENGEIIVITNPKELAKVRDGINSSGLSVIETGLTYLPINTIEITDQEMAKKIINLMDALEDLDDVVATHTNFDIADGIEVT